jgi:hypothetical protein
VTLAEPVVVAMGAAGEAGTVELSLPLTAFDPPLSLGVARNLATAWLPEPWSKVGAVRLALSEEGLEPRLMLTVQEALPRPWAHSPARLELRTRDGRLGIVELSTPAICADYTAVEKRRTRDEMFALEQQLVALRARLAEIEVRRSQVRAQLLKARPAVWALATEFPGAGATLAELSATLLTQGNTQAKFAERTEQLRAVIARLEAEPALNQVQRALSTHEQRNELTALEPALFAIDSEVAELIAEVQRRAREAGQEDALLARADFFLGQYPQSGIEGTFEHLLQQAGAAQGISPEDRVRALTGQLKALAAQLSWYEREPVTHQVATLYARLRT